MSYLAIQLIQIVCDDHRGAPDAEKRERLRAVPLPAIAGTGVFHDCRADVWTRFELRGMVSGVPERDGVVTIADTLAIRTSGRKLEVAGVPGAPSQQPLVVADDTWARIVWDRKDSDGHAKSLVELVVNVGRFSGPPPASVFLGTPAVQRDLRHDTGRPSYRALR